MIPTDESLRSARRAGALAGAAAAGALSAGAWAASPNGYVLAGAILACVGAGVFVYRLVTRKTRRRLAVLARPFPHAWQQVLDRRVAFYAALGDDDEKLRFRKLLAVFLDETPITPSGVEVDDTCRVLVAASAVIPIFALPAWEYDMLREVIVRGEQFDFLFPGAPRETEGIQGLVGTTGGAFNGTMVLSKADLLRGFENRPGKHNVGIHEFAHLIDKADGAVDGIPASLPRPCLRPWMLLVRQELQRGLGGRSDIPEYAFTNEQEFFAVAAEYFFQAPDELAANHPELYDLLQRTFRQDTRTRLRGLVRKLARRRSRRGEGPG